MTKLLISIVSLARESISSRQTLELLHQESFLQLDSSDFVFVVLHWPWPSVPTDTRDVLRSENHSRLRSGSVVHPFVGLSRHCSKDGTETRDDSSNGLVLLLLLLLWIISTMFFVFRPSICSSSLTSFSSRWLPTVSLLERCINTRINR